MKKSLKQCLSIFLSLCLFAGLCVPSFAALDGDYNTTLPTVYLEGQGGELYTDKEQGKSSGFIHSIDVPDGYIGDAGKALIRPLLKGLLTDNWDDWVNQFVDSVVPLFEKQALDENGEASNGSGINFSGTGGNRVNEDGTYQIGAYMPSYDWRLDPCVIAGQLHDYLGRVKQRTGAESVNLMGRSIGASVLLAYLAEYGMEHLETVVLYCPSFFGMDVLSKAFAGKTNIDPEAVNDFTEYYVNSGKAADAMGEEDDQLLQVLLDVVSVSVALHTLDLPAGTLERIYQKVYKEVYPRLLVKMYGSMPSFWSLVGDDDYEQAKANVFGGQEDVYAGLIEKIDRFHYDVLNKSGELLTGLVESGAKIHIVTKYGVPSVPVIENAKEQSDMLTSVRSASYGATCADYGKTLSDAYLKNAEQNGTARFVSADKVVDASTCLLPEHTWFICDVDHRSMPEGINALFEAILNFDGYMTVFDDPQFPQYLHYDKENGLTTLPEEQAAAKGDSIFTRIIRILKFFIQYIRNYFTARL